MSHNPFRFATLNCDFSNIMSTRGGSALTLRFLRQCHVRFTPEADIDREDCSCW